MKNCFRSAICSFVSIGLLISPLQKVQAQQTTNAACIDITSLPSGYSFSYKDPSFSGNYQNAPTTTGKILVTNPHASALHVAIWKRIPQNERDANATNILTYTVNLSPTATPNSCDGLANYKIDYIGAGWELTQLSKNIDTNKKANNDNDSSAKMVVGGLIALGLLAAMFGGGSSTNDTTTSRSNRDSQADAILQRRIDQERRDAERQRAAEQERQAAESYRRMQNPNSLGW